MHAHPSRLFSPRTRLRFIWACLCTHIGAIALMLTVLAPGFLSGDLPARRAYVASPPIGWSLGWGAWALASLSLLLVFAAWASTLEHRGWGRLAVAITLAGSLVDWLAELVWIVLAPGWAVNALSDPFHHGPFYAFWERSYEVMAIGVAHTSYCVSGLILSAISWRAPSFPRWLAWSSAILWTGSLVLSYSGLAGVSGELVPLSAATLGAFLVWLPLLGYGWLRARHPLPRSEAVKAGTSFRETLRALVPKHPLPMRTVFRDCYLANFAVDPEVMRRLLPAPIEPALYEEAAFLSVVIGNMDRMRPAFLPRAFGVTYNQVVYRAVVRCRGETGVHFLRSDADSRLMSFAGDWLTFFRFHHSQVSYRQEDGLAHFDLRARPEHRADIHATFDLARAGTEMPTNSRFASLPEAQAFLVELFAAFAHDPVSDRVSTVRIRRGEWTIHVVPDRRASYEFMDGSRLFPSGSAHLDSVFYVREIPYYWHTLEKRRT